MLTINEEDPVVYLHRVRYANGSPIAIERSYFTLPVGKHVLYMDPDHGSLHAKLRDVGIGQITAAAKCSAKQSAKKRPSF